MSKRLIIVLLFLILALNNNSMRSYITNISEDLNSKTTMHFEDTDRPGYIKRLQG